MSNRSADVTVRYVLDVIDRGLSKALGLTRDMATESQHTSKVVEGSTKLQMKQWDALAQLATRSETAIAKAAITRSDVVDKSLDKQIAKQREMGASYDAIIAKQREMGTSAAALASSIERNAAKQVAALQGVRREAERPVHRAPIMGGAGSGLRGVGTALGVAGVGTFLGAEGVNAAVKATIDRTNQAQTLMLAGISNANAQALAAGAQALDVPQQTLGVGIKTLAQKSTAALRPDATVRQAQPFIDLGVPKATLQRDAGDTSKLLSDIADKLATAQKGSKAYAAGTALLGKSFTTLHPLLEDGSKGLERNTELAKKYGLITSGDTAKGIKQLHDNQVELKFAMMGLETSIAKNLTPTLIKLLPAVSQLVRTISAQLKPAIHDIGQVLGPVVKFFKDGSTASRILAGALIGAASAFTVVTVAQKALSIAMAVNPIGAVIIGLAALAGGLYEAYKHIKGFHDAVDGAWSVLKDVAGFIKDHWKILAAPLLGPFEAVTFFLKDWGPGLLKGVTGAFSSVFRFLTSLPGKFAHAASSAASAFAGAMSSTWKSVAPKFDISLNPLHPHFHLTVGGHRVFREGGLMPAMVSPGEMLVSPAGGASMVPGARTAADSVFAMLAPGTAVVTGHGQSLLAAGASLPEALSMQMPHFRTGTDALGYTLPPAKKGPKPKKDTGPHEYGKFLSTAYGPPWTQGNGHGITATGVNLSKGQPAYVVAVDPSVIPLHTKLQINPNPFGSPNIVFRAEDTGGAIKGHRIDFYDWMGRPHQNKWGRREVDARYPGAGTSATSAPAAAQIKIPGLSNKTIGSPLDAFQAGVQAGLSGDSLAGSGLIGQAVKDIAVSMVTPKSATLSAAGGTRLDRMTAFANRLNAMHIPYGAAGHSGWAINKMGEDCSSSVSKVLHAGGFLDQVLTTVGLPGALTRGAGKKVTVHDRPLAGNAGHTIIELGGRFFGTSASNPRGGPGWIPRPSGSYLAQLATKLHPAGFRAGGTVGGHASSVIGRDIGALTSLPGGTVDGTIGRTITSIGHWLDVANGLTNGRLGQLENSLKSQIKNLVAHHASPITIRRLAVALNLVESEVGKRVGALVKQVTDAQALMARQVSAFGRFQRLQVALGGPAADSVTGLTQAATEQGVVAASIKTNIATLQHALKIAQAHHDTKDIASITDQLNQAQDDLQEAIVTGIEDQAAAVAKAAQDAKDAAHLAESNQGLAAQLAQGGEQALELQQQLDGTFDTAGGGQQRADYIRTQIVPQLQKVLDAANTAYNTDKANGADQATLLQDLIDIQNDGNAIAQANVDATQQVASNTDALKNFDGSTGFEFQGQSFTDLLPAGIGV